jgi:inosose dehydratase
MLWHSDGRATPDRPPDPATILDEIARVGFEGIQLGSGFPEGPDLRTALARRGLRLAEVYVPLPATVDGPVAGSMDIALERLRLLHAAGGQVLCVALDGSRDREVRAGRATTPGTPVLTESAWERLIALLNEIADAARVLGHPIAFHPHAATYIETPAEIDRLVAATDRARVGVCLDVGHLIVGGGDPVTTLRALGERVNHVHLKDVDPTVLARLQAGTLDGLGQAVRERLFTELGAGILDLDGILEVLVERAYAGWLVVEQDSCSGPASESAAIGRRVLAASLRRLGAAGAPVAA